MKAIKRLVPLFICLMMIAALSVTAFAANSEANIYGELEATQVEVGEEFTFTLYNKEMTAAAFKAGFYFDNTKLEVSKISFEDIMCYNEDEEDFVEADLLSKTTKKKANADGSALGVYTFNSGVDSLCEEGVIVEVKFKAIAEGTATITLREETLGTNAFESDSVETLTVTIGTVAPACEHTSTKLVPNEDGTTHKVVCANDTCGFVVTEKEPCTGTDDGDCTTAVTCACTNVVTAAKAAHVAGEDDGDCTTAVKCVNCDKDAVAAKEHSYTTKASATQASPADCTNAAKYYVQCDNCDTVSTDKTVAVGEATGHGKVLGFLLDSNDNGTHNVVCYDCNQATEENVTCTVDESETQQFVLLEANCCSVGCKQVVKYCACCYIISNEEDVVIPATGEHTLVKNDREAATCTSNGHKEYWKCNNAGYCYEDADGKIKIDDIYAWCGKGGAGYIPVDPTNHTREAKYVDNGDNTHSATYDCCGAPFVTNKPHDYTSGKENNTCICGAVKAPEHICAHDHYDKTETTHQSICSCGKPFGDVEPHSYDLDNNNYECVCGAKYTGWDTEIDGEDDVTVHTFYVIDGVRQYSGWTKIDGDWYYLNTTSGYRAEGLSRVSYPKVEIEGNTYAPNAADIAYAESKGRDFIDATYAWFLFEDDGKFAYDSMGYVDHGDSQGKLINGMLPWHIGLVEVAEGEYRYFAGDLVNGGNVIATGKIYVSRNTTDLDVVIGGIYLFDENGAMVTGDGITDVNGVLYYLEDNRVAIEAGLVEIDGSYYYVRSGGDSAKAGQVVVGRKYWVSDTNGLLAAGMYEFDENGKMVIDPTVNANGIVEIDGVYYYYKAGVKQVGAGVVEMTDELGETFYIYVRSNGQLATGEYWPTTTNGLLERGCYDWGTDGRYYPAN